jgi:membrane protein required for colicin V production
MDWLIVVVLCASIGLSLWRGFTREAISLAGWVAAFLVANIFSVQLAVLLGQWIDSVTGRYIVAFAALFVGTLVLAGLLARLGKQVVTVSGLSLLDRLLGTLFGFARGVILIVVAVYVLRQLVPPQHLQWLHQSQLMPHIEMLLQWLHIVFSDLGEDLGPGLRA